jgi:putative ABC transport system ATP-binding protein
MFYLLPYKSALENVALGMTIAGASKHKALRESREWLGTLGLADRLHHRPDELSGGEKQRVAIARAMVKRPDVLLADEPTGNLDKDSRVGVLEEIRGMRDRLGITVVMVTHNHDDAESFADRIVVLDGRRVADERISRRAAGEAMDEGGR